VDGLEEGVVAPSPEMAVSESGAVSESSKGPWDSAESIEISIRPIVGGGLWRVAG